MAEEDIPLIYSALPQSTSIRLLEILRRNDDSLLECTLETVNLNDQPIYNCLSYTWGSPYSPNDVTRPSIEDYDPDEDFLVVCNRTEVTVKRNLYDALEQLFSSRKLIAEQPDLKKNTRLHRAALENDIYLTQHLLYNGASLDATNNEGLTPVDVAHRADNHDFLRVVDRFRGSGSERDSSHKDAQGSKRDDEEEALPRLGIERNLIWIDALCINQRDIRERSVQVNIMGSIYRSAQSVIVWLGPSSAPTNRAVQIFSHLTSADFEEAEPDDMQAIVVLETTKSHPQALQLDDEDGTVVTPEEVFNHLGIFQREWFMRTWVMQEIILARRALFLCGHYHLSWPEVYRSATVLIHSGMLENQVGLILAKDPIVQGVTQWGSARRRIAEGGDEFKLDHLPIQLMASRSTRTSDPRDKVFALLGFAAPFNWGSAELDALKADYSKDVVAVYTETARIMLTAADDLQPLSQVEDRTLQVTKGLPSWVPDYNSPGNISILTFGRRGDDLFPQYCVAENLRARIRFSHEEKIKLHVYGCEVDTISMSTRGRTLKEIHREGPVIMHWLNLILNLPPIYWPTGQLTSEAFWRTLIADVANSECPADDDIEIAFKAYLFFSLSTLYPLSLGMGQAQVEFEEHRTKMIWLGLWPTLDEQFHMMGDWSSARSFADLLMMQFSHHYRRVNNARGLFCTREGYLGLGPQSMQAGDTVWILPGAYIPFVLRKVADTDTDEYVLLGEAYVHGIMHGQHVDSEDWNLREIALV